MGNLKENAVLAQAGHQIMWVIDSQTNTFLGKMLNGEWMASTPRAFNTVQQTVETTGTEVDGQTVYRQNGEWQQNLPNIQPQDVVGAVEQLGDGPDMSYEETMDV